MVDMRWRLQFWCSMQGVIVVTPMYKKPQAVGKGSGEGGDKDAADAVKALTAALEKSQMSLKVTYPTHPCLMMCPCCTPANECFPLHHGQRATPVRQLSEVAVGRQALLLLHKSAVTMPSASGPGTAQSLLDTAMHACRRWMTWLRYWRPICRRPTLLPRWPPSRRRRTMHRRCSASR